MESSLKKIARGINDQERGCDKSTPSIYKKKITQNETWEGEIAKDTWRENEITPDWIILDKDKVLLVEIQKANTCQEKK